MEAPVRPRRAPQGLDPGLRAHRYGLLTACTSWSWVEGPGARSWTRSGLFAEACQGPVVIESIRLLVLEQAGW